jgi:hypothetical protein
VLLCLVHWRSRRPSTHGKVPGTGDPGGRRPPSYAHLPLPSGLGHVRRRHAGTHPRRDGVTGLHGSHGSSRRLCTLSPPILAHHSSLKQSESLRVILVGADRAPWNRLPFSTRPGIDVEVLIRRPAMRILIGGKLRPLSDRWTPAPTIRVRQAVLGSIFHRLPESCSSAFRPGSDADGTRDVPSDRATPRGLYRDSSTST